MITKEERQYIIDNMKELLTEYYYYYSDEALNLIIDEWVAQKGGLIEAFKKHPNYQPGKFMIAFDHDYERMSDIDESYRFSSWLINKRMECSEFLPDSVKQRMEYWEYFPYNIADFINNLKRYAERCISVDTASYINEIIPEVHAHSGEKTSRVINRMCCYLGFDKIDGYNKEFAKYADSLSPITVKRHTILSINPLDYLTMSFGNSWASCHTIDKTNKRDMPNSYSGAYSSGTMSYMLDPSSMVLYTIDSSYTGTEYWSQPKVNRQMFHWGEDKLVQSRLYPQANDGMNSFYEPYRHIVQEIISTIFDVPNLWTLKKGTSNASRHIISHGTHYRDYESFNSCNISIVKGSENMGSFVVGARPICVECGNHHFNPKTINCCGSGGVKYCAECGEEIDEGSGICIDGEWYCEDCVYWCPHCESYHARATYVYGTDAYVCDYCLDEYYVYCDSCNEYHLKEDSIYVSDMNKWFCECCYDDIIRVCKCGKHVCKGDMYTVHGESYCYKCFLELIKREAF